MLLTLPSQIDDQEYSIPSSPARIQCKASGTNSNIILDPELPIDAVKNGAGFGFFSKFSGNINTGFLPGAQVTITIPGFGQWGVWGPDGKTKCGIEDFIEGGYYAVDYVRDLNAGFGGFVVVSPAYTGTQSRMQHGQCRFVAASANTVNLEGYNGYGLLVRDPAAGFWIMRNVGGGLSQRIDNGTAYVDGVPGQSLASNTLYYAYAAIVGGNLVLDFSTTGHGSDPALGIQVKATDPNRTYVGMVYTKGGAVGPFTGANGICLASSWFNRQAIQTQVHVSAAGVTQTAPGTLTADKLCLVTHADDTPMIHASGYGVGRAFMKLWADMVAGPCVAAGTQYGSISGGNGDPFALHSVWGQPIPEGYIEVYPVGWVDSGSTDFELTVNAQVYL